VFRARRSVLVDGENQCSLNEPSLRTPMAGRTGKISACSVSLETHEDFDRYSWLERVPHAGAPRGHPATRTPPEQSRLWLRVSPPKGLQGLFVVNLSKGRPRVVFRASMAWRPLRFVVSTSATSTGLRTR